MAGAPPPPDVGLGRKIAGYAASVFAPSAPFAPAILGIPRQQQYQSEQQQAIAAMKELYGIGEREEQREYDRGEDLYKRGEDERERDVKLALGGIYPEPGMDEGLPPAPDESSQTRRSSPGQAFEQAGAIGAAAAEPAPAPSDRPRPETITIGGKRYRTPPPDPTKTPSVLEQLRSKAMQELQAEGATGMEQLIGISRAGQYPSRTPQEKVEELELLEEARQKILAKYRVNTSAQRQQVQEAASYFYNQAGGDPDKAAEAMIASRNDPSTPPEIRAAASKYSVPMMVELMKTKASMNAAELFMMMMLGQMGAGEGGGESAPAPPPADPGPYFNPGNPIQ